MARKVIDYDAARAEVMREPVRVLAFGREWELYSALPARLIFDVAAKFGDDETSELSLGDMLTVMREAVPPQVLEEWFDLGLELDDAFVMLFRGILGAYTGGGSGDAESEEGKALDASLSSSATSSSTGE